MIGEERGRGLLKWTNLFAEGVFVAFRYRFQHYGQRLLGSRDSGIRCKSGDGRSPNFGKDCDHM